MLAEQENTVDDWVSFLGKEHMPAMAETVQKLSRLTTDDDSRVSQLTEQILKDPSLTSRVLQVVNSAVYKGYGGNITTITRAIVMMGFNAIRDTSMSMQILDNILKHNPSDHLMMQLANSFHGAMQARSMVTDTKIDAQEEIFISTLLLHFAEMSMLSRDDEISRKLKLVLQQGSVNINDAAKQVLGCSFQDISLALARQWDLGDVLIEALSKPSAPSKPAQAVLLGDELSQVAMLGWNSKPVEEVIKKIAEFRNVSAKEALIAIKATADSAQDMAVHYGAAKVRHLIPTSDLVASNDTPVLVAANNVPNLSEGTSESDSELSAEGQAQAQAKQEGELETNNQNETKTEIKIQEENTSDIFTESGSKNSAKNNPTITPATNEAPMDEGIEELMELALSGNKIAPKPTQQPELLAQEQTEPVAGVGGVQMQMDIMAKLNELIAEKRLNVNEMLDMVMGGMCDAIGLDRVVMALVSRDRKKLVPKFFKGMVEKDLKERFAIRLDEENAFSSSVLQSQPLWIGSRLMAGRSYLHTKHLHNALTSKEYFVSPIIVSRKPIGIFFGDKAITKLPLNDQQYAGFNMLAQQAGLALSAAQS